MTNIGKPYEGKPHVRFDEEGLESPALYSSLSVSALASCDERYIQNSIQLWY